MSLVSGLYRMGTPVASTDAEISRRIRRKLRKLMELHGPEYVLASLDTPEGYSKDSVRYRLVEHAKIVADGFTNRAGSL
jgi:hypothetical protein